MALDPSIAMGYQPIKLDNPMNSLAQLMQLEGARNQNRLADLQFQQHQQTQDDARNVNALYSRFTKPDGTIDEAGMIQAAAQGNMGSKIPTFRKQFAETAEAKGKLDKQNVELIDAKLKQSRGFLDGVTTPEQYIAWHEGNHKDPILGPMLASRGVTAEQSRKKIADALQTLGGLEKLIAESKLGSEKFMELNKPTIQNVNNGKTATMYSVPGMGGAPTAINTTQMTTTPSDDLRSQDAAKSRAQSATQHKENLQEKKDSNSSGKAPAGWRWSADGKSQEPIPGGPADKAAVATEGERKAATLLQRLEFSQKQLDVARKANPSAVTPGLAQNGLEMIGMDAAANALNSTERQQIEGAQLDMLDAALTLGTGAAYTREQLKGYAKSYFPQIGDDDKTVSDKDARLKNVIDAAKIAAGRARNKSGAEGDKPAVTPSGATVGNW